ncbi:hypothetical protein B0H34DRAFT_711615 [Crassisporium funariophilum]|nr:hypothetical protein B0H34DRAFT_711615 [Crassisporium funariophilum]
MSGYTLSPPSLVGVMCLLLGTSLSEFALSGRHRLIARFAPELCDRILDNLHDSKRDLSVCSTVCRSWLPTCRYHLFAEVAYQPDFAQLLYTSTHAAETIAPHIRKIIFKGPLSQYTDKNVLYRSFLHLNRLTKLYLERISWESMDPLTLTPFTAPKLATASNLAVLDLKYIHFPSFAVLAEFLDSFLALQELSVESVTWDCIGSISAGSASPVAAILPPSSLKKLHIAFCHNRVVLNWLRYGVTSDIVQDDKAPQRLFPRLAALSLPDILPGDAEIVGAFLVALGECLECLEVGFLLNEHAGRDSDAISDAINLAPNSHVKHISLQGINLFQFPSRTMTRASSSHSSMLSSPPYAWVSSILSTAQSADLQDITLHIWFSAETQLDMINWTTLSQVINDLKIPQICFNVSGLETDRVEAWLQARLVLVDPLNTTLVFDFPAGV